MKLENSKLLAAKKPVLKKLLDMLLEVYPYASILATDSKAKDYRISSRGSSISVNDWVTEIGYVIRVYDGESYGEYAIDEIKEDKLTELVDKIKSELMPLKESLPKGNGVCKYPEIPDESICFEKSVDCEINPENIGDDVIMSRLADVRGKGLAMNENAIDVMAGYDYQIYHKLFLSPNKDLTQNVMWSQSVLIMLCPRGQEVKNTMETACGCAGFEVLDELEGKLPKLVENMGYVMASEPIVPGEYECICAPGVTGVIVHEAFGHGVEMDMFVKDRALAREYVGKPVASELVTMHDGAAVEYLNTGTFFFDDEGTIAQDTVVIEKGILKGGICDAQAGMQLNYKPTGNGRRQRTNHKAYTRMTNTYFEAGTDKLEDMIASIKYGFLLDVEGGGMEDPKNWGIQCVAEIAREIKDGKFTGKVFSPVTITGYVPDLLKSISMMSDTVEMIGAGWCGKGHKEYAKVAMGGPYIKVKVRLG